MYSRDLGGVRSDGQLYGLGLESVPLGGEAPKPEQTETQEKAMSPEKTSASVLSHPENEAPKWDDLLLPAIALLLLSGDHKNDDLLVLLIGLLLLF